VKTAVRCVSVNKTHRCIVTDSLNYTNSGGGVSTIEVVMWRSNRVKLQNKGQEKYPFLFK
jgi:hypothetical protein